VADLEKSLTQAYVYDWRYSEHRKRRHGNSVADLPASCFVVFSQNHDQIGNRMRGERLSSLVSFEKLKLAAAAVILSPYIPLLFMGEEFGEEHPFLYFTSHGDQDLVQAVRKGRAEEFKAFAWSGEPPDPQSEETFRSSVLSWEKRSQGRHGSLLAFYQELIRLRRESPVMARPNRHGLKTECYEKDMTLLIHRGDTNERILLAFNFGAAPCSVSAGQGAPSWSKILDSAEPAWAGPGSDIPEKLASQERFTLPPASAVLLRAQSG
jgi:maltooligosyltrehalose trehalohydrolase